MSFDDIWTNYTPTKETTEAKPIPKGEYLVEITRCGMQKTEWGKRAEFEFTLLDHDYKGRKLWANFSLDGDYAVKGIQFLKDTLHRLGVDKLVKSGKDLQPTLNSLVGSEVVVYTKPRTYTNKAGEKKETSDTYVQYVPTDEEKSFGKSEGDSDVPF